MALDSVRIELRLNVLPGDKIQIPGCEPISDITSRTLSQRWKCPQTLVDLGAVLDAIPEARVEFGSNWGQPGYRQKWLVLPGRQQVCCQPGPDWYAILRQLGQEQITVVDQWDSCDVLEQGFCPAPGFNLPVARPVDPYLPEGATPYGVAVTLGEWVPPWQASDSALHETGGDPYAGHDREGGYLP